jgi:hypothetical protein
MVKSKCAVKAVYPNATCLLEYLHRVLHIDCIASLQQVDDPADYVRLLQHAKILPETNPPEGLSMGHCPGSTKPSIRDVLNRAISVLLKAQLNLRDQNCITLGYRQKAMHSVALMRNHMNTECFFVNTIHKLFMTRAWQLLLDRIGKDCK